LNKFLLYNYYYKLFFKPEEYQITWRICLNQYLSQNKQYTGI
jgi:hypothetical protein